jgi:hypothetical protein
MATGSGTIPMRKSMMLHQRRRKAGSTAGGASAGVSSTVVWVIGCPSWSGRGRSFPHRVPAGLVAPPWSGTVFGRQLGA